MEKEREHEIESGGAFCWFCIFKIFVFFFFGSLLTWIKTVVELFPVVQPNLDQTGIIVIDYLRGAAGEGVRRRFAEHVTHTGAGRDLEHAAAHPHLDIFRIGFRFRGLCVCVFIYFDNRAVQSSIWWWSKSGRERYTQRYTINRSFCYRAVLAKPSSMYFQA